MHAIAASLQSTVDDDLPSLKAAEEVEIALSDQQGLLSSYVLSERDQSWLEQLRRAKAEFSDWFSCARANAHTSQETEILDELEKLFAEYEAKCNKAVLQFDHGQRNEAVVTFHKEVWPAYNRAYECCEKLIDVIDGNLQSTTEHAQRASVIVAWCMSLGSVMVAGLAAALAWVLIRRVFLPLRRMAADARIHVGSAPDAAAELVDDEVRSVGGYFRAVMADATKTRTALAESQNRMWNAEKLAAVGKLAACVAHEMRNPLSSMKMWLYSIRKVAGPEPALDHKYQILSDEINRLESIVRNVLEFSRPPSLRPQPHSIVRVIDKTLEIVRPWLETKQIRVVQDHAAGLPDVVADPEQLGQVFVNLLDNAAAAMPAGGTISISTIEEVDANGFAGVVVRVQDTGHGIPNDIRSRLFEPFFTTKQAGTGLGLCIAANILAAQGGRLVLESSTAGGTTFAVRLPIAVE
jgi:signal transduction histidine kinase